MENTLKKSRFLSTRSLVKVALLSAISFILMFVEMPIPGVFPDFLKIDISDIPALIAGMAFGPIAGLFVEVVKNVLHGLAATTTGGIGEVANIVVGSAFVMTTSFIYRRGKNLKTLLLGFLAGTIAIAVVGCIINYFVMLPFYGQFMGLDAIIALGSAINPKVNTLLDFVLWFIGPFNLLKGLIISVLTIPIYKKLERVIKGSC